MMIIIFWEMIIIKMIVVYRLRVSLLSWKLQFIAVFREPPTGFCPASLWHPVPVSCSPPIYA
jgi:hypothetical protein